jgi:hypothetical protein
MQMLPGGIDVFYIDESHHHERDERKESYASRVFRLDRDLRRDEIGRRCCCACF